MNEKNIALLRQLVNKQREVCRNVIACYGEEHKLTKQNLCTLGHLTYLLAKAERRCKV